MKAEANKTAEQLYKWLKQQKEVSKDMIEREIETFQGEQDHKSWIQLFFLSHLFLASDSYIFYFNLFFMLLISMPIPFFHPASRKRKPTDGKYTNCIVCVICDKQQPSSTLARSVWFVLLLCDVCISRH